MLLQPKLLPIIFLCGFLISCQSNIPKNETNKDVTTLAPLKPFQNNTIDGILVSIADQPILLSDFQHTLAAVSNQQTQINSQGKLIGGTMTPQQASSVLQSLINQKVLEMKASELGFDVGEEELSSRISEFLQRQNLTETDLQTQLAKEGKSLADYRQQFKNELLKQELISRVISPLVTVTDDEVKSYYLQQTGSIKQVSAVKLRSLVIHLPDNYSGNPQDYAPVQKVQNGIQAKKDFIQLVKSYSQASDAAQTGGLLPPRHLSDLPPQLKEKLGHLNVNDIVGPIVLGSSVFFFQYIGAELDGGNDFKQNYTTWKNKLLNVIFEERVADYLTDARRVLKVNERPFLISR